MMYQPPQTFACLVLASLLTVSELATAQDLDFDQNGSINFQDLDSAQTEQDLERLLRRLGSPRGNLSGMPGLVTFPDYLILSANFGKNGPYSNGDLNLNGTVDFEDWPIWLFNFLAASSSYQPAPAALPPESSLTLAIDSNSNQLVLEGDGAITGLRLASEAGAMRPALFPGDTGLFETGLANESDHVVFVNISAPLPVSEELLLPIRLNDGWSIDDIKLSWSETGSYAIFPNNLMGDFNGDGILGFQDIDLLTEQVRSESFSATFDLNNDRRIDDADRHVWVEDVRRTFFGDADLNGSVQFPDFLSLSGAWASPGTWSDGDFDGDGQIAFPDFLLLSANFGRLPEEIRSVPEPITIHLALFTALLFVSHRAAGGRSV